MLENQNNAKVGRFSQVETYICFFFFKNYNDYGTGPLTY